MVFHKTNKLSSPSYIGFGRNKQINQCSKQVWILKFVLFFIIFYLWDMILFYFKSGTRVAWLWNFSTRGYDKIKEAPNPGYIHIETGHSKHWIASNWAEKDVWTWSYSRRICNHKVRKFWAKKIIPLFPHT